MTGKILLIEDDLFFQKFYTAKLNENAYYVETATNGNEGLKKMRNDTFQLVLLDLVMPQMDGFEVLRQKSLDSKLQKIPVIVFSTLSQEKDLEEAKKLGANDYMNKTFYNFEELLGKIKVLIE